MSEIFYARPRGQSEIRSIAASSYSRTKPTDLRAGKEKDRLWKLYRVFTKNPAIDIWPVSGVTCVLHGKVYRIAF